MVSFFSTDEVHPRDRISYWRDVAVRELARHEFTTALGPSFNASIRMGNLADLAVATIECDSSIASRTARDAARDDIDDVYVCVHRAGKSIIAQDGREVVEEGGGLFLMDMRRPISAIVETRTRAVIFKVPRLQVEARLGSTAALTARSIPSHRPLAGMASEFLTMISERVGTFDDSASQRIAGQALDLIALAFSTESDQNGAGLSSARVTAATRLKAAVETSLCDPALKPPSVAAAAGISVRYANTLLSQEGTSLERYIQDRRLERCRGALGDPSQAHRTIGEIAYSWGFSDVSHFGRRFKAEFGCSPSEFRRQLKLGASLETAARV